MTPVDKGIVAQYITFRVARQDFAMEASCIRGLLPLHDLVMLAGPHQWVVGIAAIRERDFPVIDLRAKLGIRHGTRGRRPCIVAVELSGPRLVGFIADRVSDVIELRNHDPASNTVRISGRTRRVFNAEILAEDVALSL